MEIHPQTSLDAHSVDSLLHITVSLPLQCAVVALLSEANKTFRIKAMEVGKKHGMAHDCHWCWAALMVAVIADQALVPWARTHMAEMMLCQETSPCAAMYCKTNKKQAQNWNRQRCRYVLRIVLPGQLRPVWNSIWEWLQKRGATLLPTEIIEAKYLSPVVRSMHWKMLACFLHAVYRPTDHTYIEELLDKNRGKEKEWLMGILKKHLMKDCSNTPECQSVDEEAEALRLRYAKLTEKPAKKKYQGHLQCTSADGCIGSPDLPLVCHTIGEKMGDVYCEECWKSFYKAKPTLTCIPLEQIDQKPHHTLKLISAKDARTFASTSQAGVDLMDKVDDEYDEKTKRRRRD